MRNPDEISSIDFSNLFSLINYNVPKSPEQLAPSQNHHSSNGLGYSHIQQEPEKQWYGLFLKKLKIHNMLLKNLQFLGVRLKLEIAV